MRTELSSQGRIKYKSSPAWGDGFRSVCQGRVSHTPQITFILPPQHFYIHISAFILEHWTNSPVLVSGPNTRSVQRAQLLLVSLYFPVRSLPVMAFCKTIHSFSTTKKIWKSTILLHHSFYHKLHLTFQNTVSCYTHCALMRHGFTRCSPAGASWSSAWLPGSQRRLLALLCHSPWSWHSCQPW